VNGWIDANAQSGNHNDAVGWASSSQHGRWTIMKDDFRTLYNVGGWEGHPVYWLKAA